MGLSTVSAFKNMSVDKSKYVTMTDEQLKEAGVAPDLIRFSVGIENVKDIIADLEYALSCV